LNGIQEAASSILASSTNNIKGLIGNRLTPWFFVWSYFTAILPLLEFLQVISALADEPDYVSRTGHRRIFFVLPSAVYRSDQDMEPHALKPALVFTRLAGA
jgi:hypothetical protein